MATEPDDLSRFLIRSPAQIGQILRAIADSAAIVTAYFNRGREFLLTAIVDVDQPSRTVLIDRGKDEALNQKLLASDRVVLVSAHEKVKVQFSVSSVRLVEYEGRPTFEIDLPEELMKLQRREFFRVQTTHAEPILCLLPVPEGNPLDMNVLDVSIGGISAHGQLPEGRSEIGTRFAGASLRIAGEAPLAVELELRSRNDIKLRNGTATSRLALRFVDLPESAQKVIQRYILRVQRERKSREL